MKTVKKVLCIILTFVVIALPIFAFADEEITITKDYPFTHQGDTNFSYDAPNTITEGGNEFELDSLTYEVISQREPEELFVTLNINSLDEIKKYETITQNVKGEPATFRAVNLDDAKWEKGETGMTRIVKYDKVTYATKEEIPQSIVIDGYTCKRYEIEEKTTLEEFTTPAYFTSTDKNNKVYSFNGKLVEISGSDPVWDGWKEDVIDYLKATPNTCIIDSISWNGDFTGENGNYKREATVTGKRATVSYIASFGYDNFDELDPSKMIEVWQADVKYIQEGGTTYEVVAHAIYKAVPKLVVEENNGLSLKQVLGIGAGVAALAGCGAGLFFFLSKKKKDKDK